MKIFKRIISVFMIMTMFSSMTWLFTSCSKSNKTLSIGDYLSRLSLTFGMESYQSKEPHVKNVSKDNEYFDVVQVAYEWDIIDGSIPDLNSDVTKSFAANTLVKAVGIENIENASAEEIAQIASDKGYITFKYKGRTDGDKTITTEEACDSLEASFEIWTNRDFGAPKADTDWVDGVNDFTDLKKDDYYQLSDNQIGITRDIYDKLMSVSSDGQAGVNGTTKKLEKGDKFVMPATDTETITMHEVADVDYKDDYVIITKTENDPDPTSSLENFESSGSTDVDFRDAEITDGLGNPVTLSGGSTNVELTEKPIVGFIGSDVSGAKASKVGSEKGSIDFEISGFHVKGSFSQDSINFSVDGTVMKTQKSEMKIKKSYEIKDIHIDHDIKNKMFKIEKAYVNVKYTTVDTTDLTFDYKKDIVYAPEHSNGNGKFPTNFSKSIWKDSEAKGAKSIKICNFRVWGSEALSLRFVVEIHISVSGKVTLTVTTENEKGFDYQKGNLRFIKAQDPQSDLTATGQAELSAYIGLSALAVGDWINIIGGGFEVGVGVKVDVVARMADNENRLYEKVDIENANSEIAEAICKDGNGFKYIHDEYGTVNLHFDVCSDLVLYWKVWIGVDSESEVGKILKKGNINLSVEFGGPDDGRINEWHFEDGHKVSACTRDYSNAPATTTEASTTEDITAKEIFKIDKYNIVLNTGESSKINIKEIPEGYSQSDIQYESSNTEIATVGSDGTVVGVAPGSSVVTVKTSDGRYNLSCAIIVS